MRLALLVIVLALGYIPAWSCAEKMEETMKGPGWIFSSREMRVGTEIPFDAVSDFYYTYASSTFPPEYQRYRFYRESGKCFFYHETREGAHWPLGEEDATLTGTLELSQAEWDAFCSLLRDGAARVRQEHLESGDAGPWLYIYWTGGEKEGREFTFASGAPFDFEEFCEKLRESSRSGTGR